MKKSPKAKSGHTPSADATNGLAVNSTAEWLEEALMNYVADPGQLSSNGAAAGYFRALLDMTRVVRVPNLATVRMAHALWDAYVEETVNA